MTSELAKILGEAPQYRIVHDKQGEPKRGHANDTESIWKALFDLDEVLGSAIEHLEDNVDIMDLPELRPFLARMADMYYQAGDLVDGLASKIKDRSGKKR